MKTAYLLPALLSPAVFALQLWLCRNTKALLPRFIPLAGAVLGVALCALPSIKDINWQNLTEHDIHRLLLTLSAILALVCDLAAWGVYYIIKFYSDKIKEDENTVK